MKRYSRENQKVTPMKYRTKTISTCKIEIQNTKTYDKSYKKTKLEH